MDIKPLDRFPFIRTTDVHEMRKAIAKAHGDNKLQMQRGAEGFHAYGNRRALGSIVLSYASFGAAVDQEFSAFTGFAQQFRIRGSSEIIVDRAPVQLAPYQSFILSPGATMKLTHSHDLEHFVLKIDRDALRNKWTALTGRQPRSDLKFEPAADFRTPEATYLRRLFIFLVDQLASSERSVPPLSAGRVGAIRHRVSFLCANRHNESHLLDREPMGTEPWQVRRAEEYIEAHWDRNLGHFAKDYGKCFGELPSETLNRTKGAAVRPTVKAASAKL